MRGGGREEQTAWGSEFPRRSWFDVRQLEAGVHLVSEPGHVNSFLIEGTRAAVLLDTGLGVANIRAVAEELTGKPLGVNPTILPSINPPPYAEYRDAIIDCAPHRHRGRRADQWQARRSGPWVA